METSGKSGRSRANTAPMLMLAGLESPRPAAALTMPPAPGQPRQHAIRTRPWSGGTTARMEDEAVLADLHLITVMQDDLVDPVAIDVGTVQAADVTNQELAVAADE